MRACALLRLSVTFCFGQTGTRDERIPHKQDTRLPATRTKRAASLVHESAPIRDTGAFPRSGPIAHSVSSSCVPRMTQPRLLKHRRNNCRVQKAAPIIAETGVGSTSRQGCHRCAERRQTVAPFFSYLDGRSPCALTMRLAALLRGSCVEYCVESHGYAWVLNLSVWAGVGKVAQAPMGVGQRGARASKAGAGREKVHPTKHQGTAERERSTAPELH